MQYRYEVCNGSNTPFNVFLHVYTTYYAHTTNLVLNSTPDNSNVQYKGLRIPIYRRNSIYLSRKWSCSVIPNLELWRRDCDSSLNTGSCHQTFQPCFDVGELVNRFHSSKLVDSDPGHDIEVSDRNLTAARSNQPVAVLGQSNFENAVEPLRFVNVALLALHWPNPEWAQGFCLPRRAESPLSRCRLRR